MKISRFKKSQKILAFFSTNFNYHEPFQILVDATFCQAALQNKVIVEEQLKRCFQSPVKLVTTQCIILEAESIGAPLNGATMIVKQFLVHKCGHEGKPISAANCIMSMTKDSRYIVASQDRSLQDRLRKVPGRCLLYLHKSTPVLEEPSPASRKYVQKQSARLVPASTEQRIVSMKRKHGLPTPDAAEPPAKMKRKGPKMPNPLSCKKKTKKPETAPKPANTANQGASSESAEKSTKRKRLKIPAHVRAANASKPAAAPVPPQ